MGTTSRETKIGRIPEEWKVAPLGSLANITTGTKDVNEGNPDGEYPFFTCAKEHTYSDSFSFDCEALLVAGNANVGRTSYYSGKFEAYQRTYVLSAFDNVISHYLKYYLQKNLEFHLQSSVHKSAMSYIKLGYLKNFVVYLPPLPEQRRIAEILSTVDDTIEKTDAIIKETQQLKKGLMQKLFTEGIWHTRFKETKVGRIPEEWEVVNLSNVFQVIDGDRGVNYPRSNEMFDDGYCVFLNAKNVTKSGFKFNEVQFITLEKDEILGKGKLTRGDLVLTTRGTLGNFAYFNDEVTFENLRINSGMVVLRPLNNILTNYYYKYFNSYLMQNQIERLSFGTAQSQLTVGGIQKFRLLVPPNDEQRQIAQILSQVDSKIQTEQAFKEELEKLKKGLMQVLLTGKVRVKV